MNIHGLYFMPGPFTSWACHFHFLRCLYQLKCQICMSSSLLLLSMFDNAQFKTQKRWFSYGKVCATEYGFCSFFIATYCKPGKPFSCTTAANTSGVLTGSAAVPSKYGWTAEPFGSWQGEKFGDARSPPWKPCPHFSIGRMIYGGSSVDQNKFHSSFGSLVPSNCVFCFSTVFSSKQFNMFHIVPLFFSIIFLIFFSDRSPCCKLNHSDTLGGTTSGCSCSSLCAAAERSVNVTSNFEMNPLRGTGLQQ